MKKSDLIKCITQMQSNIPVALLSKTDFPKKKLEELYKRLVNGEDYKDLLDQDLTRKKSNRKSKPEKKKPVKIIEFSDSDVEEEVEEKKQEPTVDESVKVEEPKVVAFVEPVAKVVEKPVEEKKPKLNKIKVKKEIKQLLLPFLKEVKDLLFEYKTNRDKDYLLDNYNILLRDQEELYEEYLNTIDAPDEIYNYTADLLSVHTNKIERIVNS